MVTPRYKINVFCLATHNVICPRRVMAATPHLILEGLENQANPCRPPPYMEGLKKKKTVRGMGSHGAFV